MIDINHFYKSSLYQKIEFGNEIVKVNICKIIEHPIHFHSHLEIVFVMDGEISVKSSSNNFILRKGEFILLNAFEIHGIKKASAEAVIAYVYFDLEMESIEQPLLIYNSNVLKKDAELYAAIRNRLIAVIDKSYFGKYDKGQSLKHARDLIGFISANLKYVTYELDGERNTFAENELYIDRFNSILNYMYVHYDE